VICKGSPIFFKTGYEFKSMEEILEYLADHGEGTDSEIARATGIPLTDVRSHLSELVSRQAVLACSSIRFEQGLAIEEMICRMVGYSQPIKPRKKTKTSLPLPQANSQPACS
jgi:hypothetical protein